MIRFYQGEIGPTGDIGLTGPQGLRVRFYVERLRYSYMVLFIGFARVPSVSLVLLD